MHETVMPPSWRKSSYCGNTTCVEVANLASDSILVRDAKDPGGSVLSFERDTWGAFVAGIKDGAFDPH
ncbi:DUF397 domain-containing protein [Dactylosporangium sp. NPDC000555]|uniref:DUF397 domain-containing protein n=1 Tax=Dactylosporangium sp. NPDC000555 TaxID=3154260 RepID=UPI003332FECA